MGITIVQVGTNRADDDLTEMIKNLPPSLIDLLLLIEPLTVHHSKIAHCYKHIKNKIIINNVITSSENSGQIVDFYYHIADGPNYEVASTDINHILKHSGGHPEFLDKAGYRKITSYALDINTLFKVFSLEAIDILMVDAEGQDSDIIKSIDLHRYDIKNIYFENLHLPEGRQDQNAEVYKFLEKQGYALNYKCLSNNWMSHAYR